MTAVVLATMLLASGALALAWLLYRKLSAAHQRIHRLERVQIEHGRQLTSLGRASSRERVRGLLSASATVPECHAQHGEEYFLWERLGFKLHGTFVEIGAYDGVRLSNSLFFEKLGWRGLLVEAHPELVRQCQANRPDAHVVHAALGERDGGNVVFSMVRGEHGLDTLSFVETSDQHRNRVSSKLGVIEQVEVPARTLRSVLGEAGIGQVDWMSVDVEGAELAVLRGAGLDTVRPALIVVEDNSQGGDQEVATYLQGFGYRRVQTVGCNDFYALHS